MGINIFTEISIVIAIAAAISILMRILRQPMIIGYIITGLLVGPYVFGIVHSPETVRVFAELGIAFLLFVVGLNLSPRVIKEVGRVSLVTGIGQVVFTSIIGYGLARLLGFAMIPSAYLAIGLTLSSTIVVLKLLSDKRALDTMYGKIAVGFLIFQDIVAAIALIIASSFVGIGAGFAGVQILIMLAKTIALVAVAILVARVVLPFLGPFLARSQELLFVFTLGWGLSLASLFYVAGLSLEVGALVAGIALAMFPYHHEMSARMRPLRDFFIILFFVLLGSQLSGVNLGTMVIPAIAFSLFVLVGNPIIVMALMGLLGYRKRTSFLSGVTVAQVSEFSFILLALGVSNGHVQQNVLSLITMVGIVTMMGSSYMILYSEKIYNKVSRFLGVFERDGAKDIDGAVKAEYDVLLFGCNRIGWDFVEAFERAKMKPLVVDFDPYIIAELRAIGVNALYGDAGDIELLNMLDFGRAKMVVSTIPDAEIVMPLVEKTKKENPDAIVIVVSHNIDEAHHLYKLGADYVIMPHFLGGSYASDMVANYKFSKESFEYEKNKHLAYLEEKRRRGYEHPLAEKFR